MVLLVVLGLVLSGAVAFWWFYLRAPPAPTYKDFDFKFQPTAAPSSASKSSSAGGSKGGSSQGLPKAKKGVSKKEEAENEGKPYLRIFFGSQTGTAEDFAEQLVQEAEARGVVAEPIDLELFDLDELPEVEHALFMMATYGEGEPTDNAKDFWDLVVQRKEAEEKEFLSGMHYGVFGLGNKTYEHYNLMGRQTDEYLALLGGTRVVKYGEGDDDCSLEDDFAKWKKDVWPQLLAHFGIAADAQPQNAALNNKPNLKTKVLWVEEADVSAAHRADRFSGKPDKKKGVYDQNNPYYARIVRHHELHAAQSDRSCLHVEVELQEKDSQNPLLSYVPGDHLGVYPENRPQLVQSLCERLKYDGDRVLKWENGKTGEALIPRPMSVRRALSTLVDFTNVPRKNLLEKLAYYCSDEQEKAELLKYTEEGNPEYNSHVVQHHVSVYDILQQYKSCNPPFEHLIEILPKLAPRYYSISSSQLHEKNRGNVSITVAVVKFKTALGKHHEGVCTSWMSEKRPTDESAVLTEGRVPVFVRTSTFHMPPKEETPLIMIGPGTGLAPFRGFLQHREHLRKVRGADNDNNEQRVPDLLFFGCRHREHDYIYQSELEEWQQQGLIELHVAFSREKDDKFYVQHIMEREEVAKKLLRYVEELNATIYICGDANKMAKDVQEQWVRLYEKHAALSRAQAEAKLDELTKSKRYLTDVWY